MKSWFFYIMILLTMGASAQQTDNTLNNELKGNLLFTLLEFPEINYERILGDDNAMGLALGFALDSDIDYRFAALPYYRFYFGQPRAKGFFLELNANFASFRDGEYFDFNGDLVREQNQFLFGMGAAAGVKFMSSSNLVGEVYVGLGRYFNDDDWYQWGYPRIGITIGKRFK